MRNPHGGLGLVDVLTTRAARPINVDPKIARIDLDVDVVVELGRDENGCERRMTPMSRIERRLAHEPVHTGLGTQPAKRVLADEVDRRTLDPGDLTRRVLQHLRLETLGFSPAQIHSVQHGGPVLSFGATGPRLDVDERVMRVHLSAEHPAELELGDFLLDAAEVRSNVVERGLILILGC